jgi:hypothetical protein
VDIESDLKTNLKKYSEDLKFVDDLNKIEKELCTARNQAERLMIFQIAFFQKNFMSDMKEEKNALNNSQKDDTENKTKNLNKEEKLEINEIQREISFHYGYLLKYMKTTHNLKKLFLEELKENPISLYFNLWEEIDDLYNSITNDVFTTEAQAYHSFQRIRQNFKNLL